MNGIFVSGTDTGVGKTTVAAGLIKVASLTKQSRYWKPVQTGTENDTSEVAARFLVTDPPVPGFLTHPEGDRIDV